MTSDYQNLSNIISDLTDKGECFAVATVVRTENSTAANAGDKAVISSDGSMMGWIGGGCTETAARKKGLLSIEDGKVRLIRVCPRPQEGEEQAQKGVEIYYSGCPSQGITEILIEPIVPRPEMLVIGSSRVCLPLCALAQTMGYGVTLVETAANPELSDQVDHYFESLEDVQDQEKPPSFRYVVVATQGRQDYKSLELAMTCNAEYIAFIASRKKGEKLFEKLHAAGVPQEKTELIHCPAGVNIGAKTPEEIALSILAEMTLSRRNAGEAV